jgi:PadR family transcriptional regulator, regulatory protein PadR
MWKGTPTDTMRTPNDLLYGTLDLLVLRTLAWQPMHGYAIATWIRDRSRDALLIEDAALYKALHRLEERELVTSEWGLSENNRRAKYYALAPEGRRRLRAERDAWRAYVAAVGLVLEGA